MFPTEPFVLSGGLYLCYLRVLSCGLHVSLIEDSSAQARTSQLFCGVSKIISQQLVVIKLVVVPLALEVYIMATRIRLKMWPSVHLGNFLEPFLSLMQNFPNDFWWIFVCHVVPRSSAVLVMTLVLYYGMHEPAPVLPWRYLSFEPCRSLRCSAFWFLFQFPSVSCRLRKHMMLIFTVSIGILMTTIWSWQGTYFTLFEYFSKSYRADSNSLLFRKFPGQQITLSVCSTAETWPQMELALLSTNLKATMLLFFLFRFGYLGFNFYIISHVNEHYTALLFDSVVSW